jgi:hypothetical protein
MAVVIAAGLGEAERRDPGRERTWVVLADGSRDQIATIEAQAARDAAVTISVGFVHVTEHVRKAA